MGVRRAAKTGRTAGWVGFNRVHNDSHEIVLYNAAGVPGVAIPREGGRRCTG